MQPHKSRTNTAFMVTRQGVIELMRYDRCLNAYNCITIWI